MAAFNLEEPFTYSDGDLAGNSGGSNWSGAWAGGTADIDIVSNRVSAALDASEGFCSRLTTSNIDSGDAYFIGFYKDLVAATTSGWSMDFFDGGTAGTYSGVALALQIRALNSAGITLEGTTTESIVAAGVITGSPYDIHLQWLSSTSVRARAKLSADSSWGSFTAAVTLKNSKAQVNHVGLECSDDVIDTTGYLDQITTTDPVVVSGYNRSRMLIGIGK